MRPPRGSILADRRPAAVYSNRHLAPAGSVRVASSPVPGSYLYSVRLPSGVTAATTRPASSRSSRATAPSAFVVVTSSPKSS